MPIGQADLENAVREGWIRDEDNELSIDGYNTLIQISTNDGTSGFNVQNSAGAVSFSAKSDGDGYVAKRLGIGTYNPETTLEVIGKTRTDEFQVTSGAVSGYVLTSDGDGNATWAPSTASGGVTDTTFQENKTAQEEINDTILASLDGYAIRAIEDQRWVDSSQQLQDLRDSLDGYTTNQTFEENKGAQEEINDQILASLDGYASTVTESEHYLQLSQAIQDIISTIDGYSTDTELAGLNSTVTENNNQQQQINQSIRQALDGYASDQTVSEHYNQFSQAVQDIISVIDGYSTDAELAGLDNTVTENNNQQQQINQSILQSLDGYASVPDTNAIGDGYVAFFIGDGRKIAGDNDLYFDRVNNQLQVSALKLTTTPNDGYVLTSDGTGNATWQKNNTLDESEHRQLDQLVHNIAEDSFEEYTYSGAFVANITIWTNSDKVKKIREEQFTYIGAQVSQLITIQYNSSGDEIERVTENYTYSGAFVTNVSRSLT